MHIHHFRLLMLKLCIIFLPFVLVCLITYTEVCNKCENVQVAWLLSQCTVLLFIAKAGGHTCLSMAFLSSSRSCLEDLSCMSSERSWSIWSLLLDTRSVSISTELFSSSSSNSTRFSLSWWTEEDINKLSTKHCHPTVSSFCIIVLEQTLKVSIIPRGCESRAFSH